MGKAAAWSVTTLSTTFTKLFVAWGVQQIAVPILAWILVFGVLPSFEEFLAAGQTGRYAGLEDLFSAALFCIFGYVPALLVRRALPRAAVTGKWIWLLPTSMVLALFIWDLARFGTARAVTEFFYPKEGEDAWLLVLLMLPTYSCIGYSVGMAGGRPWRRRNSSVGTGHNPGGG